MVKQILAWLIAGTALGAAAAEISFDFSKDEIGTQPPSFRSLVTGRGNPAKWRITTERVPPILAPLEPNSRENAAEHSVLSVQSFDIREDHCPVLLYTNEIFDDFTLTTRFKISGGIVEPSAGLVFRAQDQSNYYVVRASTDGNLLWYRVVNGQSYQNLGIGVKLPMDKDVWRQLTVECMGSQIRCFLEGHLVLPPVKPGTPTNGVAINDTTFARGKVGFWTQADTKCSFVEADVKYTPRVPYIQVVLNNVLKKHPSLLGLKVYASKGPGNPVVVGSLQEADIGTPGTKTEADVIANGLIFYLKADKTVEITLPLRDRNGDIVAAAKVKMKSFAGETQTTAVAKAALVVKSVEEQVETLEDING